LYEVNSHENIKSSGPLYLESNAAFGGVVGGVIVKGATCWSESTGFRTARPKPSLTFWSTEVWPSRFLRAYALM